MPVKTLLTQLNHPTLAVKKIEVLADKRYRIKYDNDGTENIVLFDFTQYDGISLNKNTIEHESVIWRYRNQSPVDVHFAIWGRFSKMTRRDPLVETYPTYVYLAAGESATPETELTTYTAAGISYVDKQKRAIKAIYQWKSQKREWMTQAAERADLANNLVRKVGRWLKSADAAIKHKFQDPNTDPLIVESIANMALYGALDITDVDTFMRSVHYYNVTPDTPKLWVNPDTDPPARVNLADIVEYSTADINDHDPIDTAWLQENQDGTVTLSNTAPSVRTAITATLSDPDGDLGNQTYQWQSIKNTVITNISGATAMTYTPVTADRGNALRCIVDYTDAANPDTANKNRAISEETAEVT